MGGSIVRPGDEHLVAGAVGKRFLNGGDGDKFVDNGTKEVKSGLDLLLRILGLDDGGDDGEVVVLGADVMGRRDASHIYIMRSVDLVLRNHNLHRVHVARVGNRMLEETDGTNDPANRADLVLGVRGITDDLFRASDLEARMGKTVRSQDNVLVWITAGKDK